MQIGCIGIEQARFKAGTRLLNINSTGFNPIVELAKETATPLHLWKENTLLVDSAGQLVDAEHANNALKRVWDILEMAIDFSTANSKDIDPSTSLYDYFAGECTGLVRTGEMSGYEKELVLGMAQMWGAYVGDRVERQSLKFFFLEDCIGGGKLLE